MDWANILITACVLESLAMFVFDRGMKVNRAEGVSWDQVRWAPLYWERSELFTARGNVYRRAAQVAMVALIITSLVLAWVAAPGDS